MASRSGPTPQGTDGTDFGHREIIKEQYYVRSREVERGRTGLNPAALGGAGRGRKNGAAAGVVNDDPGVNDSEDEEEDFQRVDKFSDSQAVLREISRRARELQANAEARAQVAGGSGRGDRGNPDPLPEFEEEDLPLTGDYHGLGGPDSVPLFSDVGVPFDPPAPRPHRACILDELFLMPSDDQLRAFSQIEKRMVKWGGVLNHITATNKSRLKWCISLHFLLFCVVVLKLVPEVLDKLDIFVLELEELFIPKSHLWEWLWFTSFFLTYPAIAACRKSSIHKMKVFMTGMLLLALIPALIGMGIHFVDVYTYIASGRKAAIVEKMVSWKGYPVAVLWYAFLFVALQVHVFELYFAYVLVKAWAPKRKSQ